MLDPYTEALIRGLGGVSGVSTHESKFYCSFLSHHLSQNINTIITAMFNFSETVNFSLIKKSLKQEQLTSYAKFHHFNYRELRVLS